MSKTEPIRSKRQVKELANYYLKRGKLRNYLLIIMGVYTAMRISDLLRLKWDDIYDFELRKIKSHIYITERKTGKQKVIALNKKAQAALLLYFSAKRPSSGEYIFQSVKRKAAPIGRVQAWRIIKEAAIAIGLAYHISCHSLRKTFGYHAWKDGISPVLLMDIYNHSSYNVTRRYLGVAQDDLDGVYLGLSIV